MIVSQILTGWTGNGYTVPYHPQLSDDYVLSSWQDVTGQSASEIVPEVNLFIIEAVCDIGVLEAIENDQNYQVIWSEEQTDQTV